MQEKPRGNEYRTTVVCIDSYRGGVLTGRFYNPGCQEGKTFQSLVQFLVKMEDLLDGMQQPQSFTAKRGFSGQGAGKESQVVPGGKVQTGEKATFNLRILFRQNASWQGCVAWLEGGQEESFRSVLELVLLLDSALGGAG